jgi:dynein heavy chain
MMEPSSHDLTWDGFEFSLVWPRRDPEKGLTGLEPATLSTLLQSYFLFALVWSLGANTDDKGRQHFSSSLRRLIAQSPPPDLINFVRAPAVKVSLPFPEDKLVYDYSFDRDKLKWVLWVDLLQNKAPDVEAEYTNIIVPTVDTLRYTYVLDKLVQHNMHCLLVGPTGGFVQSDFVNRGAC